MATTACPTPAATVGTTARRRCHAAAERSVQAHASLSLSPSPRPSPRRHSEARCWLSLISPQQPKRRYVERQRSNHWPGATVSSSSTGNGSSRRSSAAAAGNRKLAAFQSEEQQQQLQEGGEQQIQQQLPSQPLRQQQKQKQQQQQKKLRLQLPRRSLLLGSSTALLAGSLGDAGRLSEASASSLQLQQGIAQSPPAFGDFADADAFDDDDDADIAAQVFQIATPSVVAILNYEVKANGRDEDESLEGTGSGFVWDKFGHIVTNYHVVAKLIGVSSGLQRTKVGLLGEGERTNLFSARLIGIDANRDLAVLKIDAEPEMLSPVLVGTSADVRVGQSCFAIGNPYGYLHTLTVGVVSGLGRAIPSPSGQPIPGAIQTDAAINSGNSGGPLLDSSGRTIGVNTATFTRSGSGSSSGVNFAIPMDTVRKVVPKLIVYGTLSRALEARKASGAPPSPAAVQA